MNSRKVLDIVSKSGVVAILRLDDLSSALELTKAVLAGGVKALEFTLTNPQAADTVNRLLKSVPEFERGEAVIGVGTVLSPEQAKDSISKGAQFLVSPNLDSRVMEVATKAGVPIMPGAITPTEIVQALNAGAEVVKLFPARSFGPSYIKDLREPLPNVKLMPTAGINLENLKAYFDAGAFALGVGRTLFDKSLVANHLWSEIESSVSKFAQAVSEARK